MTTSSGDAQRYFDQGLNLLFAFTRRPVVRSARPPSSTRPRHGLVGGRHRAGAHIHRPVVGATQVRIAWEAIREARSESAGASDLEGGLIDTLAERCAPDPPDDRSALNRAYAEAMRALRAKYPDDANVGAFAAEALMNLRPWDFYTRDGLPRPDTEEIVTRIEAVLALRPDHPLANHLYIHAVEASTRPERAELAADRLRDLQPGLSHNVHMPSHIDVRLGRWKATAEANWKAIAADRQFLAIRSDPGFYGLYIAQNYHMLAHAAMMRGTSESAIEAIDEMRSLIPAKWARENAAITDGYMVMPLEVRMRFGRWGEMLAAPEPDPVFPLARALRRYARAVAYAAQDRLEEARAEQAHFQVDRARVPEKASFGNNKAADLFAVAEHRMIGERLYREGRREEPSPSSARPSVARTSSVISSHRTGSNQCATPWAPT